MRCDGVVVTFSMVDTQTKLHPKHEMKAQFLVSARSEARRPDPSPILLLSRQGTPVLPAFFHNHSPQIFWFSPATQMHLSKKTQNPEP